MDPDLKTLAEKGAIVLVAPVEKTKAGIFTINVNYEDKGVINKVVPLESMEKYTRGKREETVINDRSEKNKGEFEENIEDLKEKLAKEQKAKYEAEAGA